MRSTARPLHIAFALTTLFFAFAARADEPKEPVPPPTPAPAATAQAAPAADRIAEALAAQPGGLTPNEAARLILRAKPALRVKEAELREAAAKVDQAVLNFLPRVSGNATYTRLSEVQNSLGTQTVLGTLDPTNPTTLGPIQQGPLIATQCPSPAPAGVNCVRDQNLQVIGIAQVPFNFPVLLNSYALAAQIAVPVSDYLLRISQAYSAVSHLRDAKKLELQAAELIAAADAKVAFFNWVLAKAASVVAAESVATLDAQLTDMQRTFQAGLVSKADVLRLEARKAQMEQGLVNATAGADFAEQNLRISLALPADKPISIGIDVLHDVPTSDTTSLAKLQEEALSKRLEVQGIAESERAMGALVSVARAQYFPRVDAFANFSYANPNQRIFPQRDEFRGTWEAGVRLSWTVNDTIAAPAAVTEAKAREAQIVALREQLLQGLRTEVAATYADLKRAEGTVPAADRGLVAAEEGLRVQNELLRAGRATATTIVDAESALTQARIGRINAHISVLVAKIRLEHAVGRDIPKP
jgi:outer membrane protein TolC